jgi:hypothetical protein
MCLPSLYGSVRIVDLLLHSPRSNAVHILGAARYAASLPLTQRFNFSKIYFACYKRSPSAAQDCWAQIKPTRVRRSSQRAGRKHACSVAIPKRRPPYASTVAGPCSRPDQSALHCTAASGEPRRSSAYLHIFVRQGHIRADRHFLGAPPSRGLPNLRQAREGRHARHGHRAQLVRCRRASQAGERAVRSVISQTAGGAPPDARCLRRAACGTLHGAWSMLLAAVEFMDRAACLPVVCCI